MIDDSRCHRLRKECRPAEKLRRRNPRKPVKSKTARLEERLDDLVSLLKCGAAPGIAGMQPSATVPLGNATLSSTAHDASFSSAPLMTPAASECTDYSYEPSYFEATRSLQHVVTDKLKYFPFIHIPPDLSAQQLQQDRPFLWLCLMTIGSKSTSQQQILAKKIRQMVAQEMIVKSEKSIEFLLGLLAFIGWYGGRGHGSGRSSANIAYRGTSHLPTKPYLSLFTQLAVSLVYDLGLNKSVTSALKEAHMVPCVCPPTRSITPRTMEERRAVLSCFVISST